MKLRVAVLVTRCAAAVPLPLLNMEIYGAPPQPEEPNAADDVYGVPAAGDLWHSGDSLQVVTRREAAERSRRYSGCRHRSRARHQTIRVVLLLPGLWTPSEVYGLPLANANAMSAERSWPRNFIDGDGPRTRLLKCVRARQRLA